MKGESRQSNITAIRGLLDTVEDDLKSKTSKNKELVEQNELLRAQLKEAHHDVALLLNNIADMEPRQGVVYLTAQGYIHLLRERQYTRIISSLSQALGSRATRIGEKRGVLPVEVYSTGSVQSRHKAWPEHVWDTALKEWEESKKF
jgi:hypothetical protein